MVACHLLSELFQFMAESLAVFKYLSLPQIYYALNASFLRQGVDSKTSKTQLVRVIGILSSDEFCRCSIVLHCVYLCQRFLNWTDFLASFVL